MNTTPNDRPVAVRHIIATTVHSADGGDTRTEHAAMCGLYWPHELPEPLTSEPPHTCKACAEAAHDYSVFTVVGHTAADLEHLPTTDQN